MSDMSDDDDDQFEYGSGSESSYSFGSDDGKSDGGDDRPHLVARDDVWRRYEETVEDVSDLTGLDADLAGVLLIVVDFDKDATNTDWFDARKAAKLKADAGLESLCEAGSAVNPDTPFSCELCLEDYDIGDTAAMTCGHRYCKDCFATHVDVDSRTCVFARCPKAECRLAVGLSTMKAILPAAGLEKYKSWVIRRFVDSPRTPGLKACPTPGCDCIVFNTDVATYPEVTCSGCSKRWCFSCQEEPHRPATCAQVKAWREKTSESDLSALWIKANTKKCPKCSFVIHKDAGCQHMTCDRCRHQFCWLCMRPYSEHSESTGGFYNCHKFAQRVKAEGKTEEEKEVLRAQRTLRNYNMAVERHLAHKQGCASAETDLLESVHRNMEVLSAANLAVGSFLTDAVAIVVQCRRVLSWSYVYKYYKFAGEGMDRELGLFEDYQGQLEQLTRRLHDMIGTDASCFVPPSNSRGGGGGAGAGAGGAAGVQQSAAAASLGGGTGAGAGAGGAGAGAGVGAGAGAGAGVGAQGGMSASSLDARSARFTSFREEVQRCGATLKRFLSSVLDFEQASKDFRDVEWVDRVDAPDDKKRAVWQWQNADKSWRSYPAAIIAQMEEGLRLGKTVQEVKINGCKFCVDLVAKSQINTASQESCQIRRVLIEGGDWSCAVCTFHNTATARECAMCGNPKPA